MADQHNTTSSSVVSRKALLGDELTEAIDAYAKDPTPERLSNFSAALVGRCASMAAAAVVALYERLDKLERARDV